MIQLDTHVVIWLFVADLSVFSKTALKVLRSEERFSISPAVMLELQYVHEIKRLDHKPEYICEALNKSIGLSLSEHPFPDVVKYALSQSWTRDPFDRLIVAQAKAENVRLLTRDRVIHKHYSKAIW